MKNIREKLALIWSIAAIIMIGYILIKYGDQKEILTLIIGLIGGTVVGGMFGFYFSSSHKDKPDASITTTNTEITNSQIT